MVKHLIIIACMFASMLEALPQADFLHTVLVSSVQNNAETQEYLVRFKIDKIVEDTSEAMEFTAPVLYCVEGQESIVSKSINGNGYTVKALVYQQDSVTRVKTSLIVHEGDSVVYSANDDSALSLE